MTAVTKYQSSASVGTTERSMPDDTTTSVPKSKTDVGALRGYVDCVAGDAASVWTVTLYEKVSAGTQRVVQSWDVVGGQVLILPTLPEVEEGWDLTAKKATGSDATVRWRLYLVPADQRDVNVVKVDGVALDTHDAGSFPADVRTWIGTAPNALTAGRVDGIVGAYASGQAPLQPTTAGRTLDVTATGEAGVDWSNIGAPTTVVNLSGTSTKALEPVTAGRQLLVGADNLAGVDVVEISSSATAADNLESHALADTDPWDAAGGGSGGGSSITDAQRVRQGEDFVVKFNLVSSADGSPLESLGGIAASIDCNAFASNFDSRLKYRRGGTGGNGWTINVSDGVALSVSDNLGLSQTDIVFVDGVTTVGDVELAIREYGGRIEVLQLGTQANVLVNGVDEFVEDLGGGGNNEELDVWASLGSMPFRKIYGDDAEDFAQIEEAPISDADGIDQDSGLGEYRIYVDGSFTEGFEGELSFHIQRNVSSETPVAPADVRVQVVGSGEDVNVVSWRGTAVADPTVEGVPRVEVDSYSSDSVRPLQPFVAGRTVDVNGSGGIAVGTIQNNKITAASLNADAVTAIQSGLATQTQVTAITNNTRIAADVPGKIEIPIAGTTTYRVELFLYDTDGEMEAPDAAPTIALVNQGGTSRASRLDNATMQFVSTGRYRTIYTSTASDTEEHLSWTFSVTEGSDTRTYGRTSTVSISDSTIDSKLDSLSEQISDLTADNPADSAAAVWATIFEGGKNAADLVRGIVALLASKATDVRTNTIVVRNLANTKTRFTITKDDSGRLSVLVGDLS